MALWVDPGGGGSCFVLIFKFGDHQVPDLTEASIGGCAKFSSWFNDNSQMAANLKRKRGQEDDPRKVATNTSAYTRRI